MIKGTGFDLANGTIYVRFGSVVVKAVPGDDNTIGVVVPAGTVGSSVSVEVRKSRVEVEMLMWFQVSFDNSEYSSGSGVQYSYDGAGCGPSNCAPHGQCLSGKCLCDSGWGYTILCVFELDNCAWCCCLVSRSYFVDGSM